MMHRHLEFRLLVVLYKGTAQSSYVAVLYIGSTPQA
jgi:hypothetical protein